MQLYDRPHGANALEERSLDGISRMVDGQPHRPSTNEHDISSRMNIHIILNPVNEMDDSPSSPSSISSSLSLLLAPSPASSQSSDEEIPVRQPHNNRPYTQEELDWLRYHREDFVQENGKCVGWTELLKRFRQAFPRGVPRTTEASLNSRYYRHDIFPVLDENDEPVMGLNGEPKTLKLGQTERKKDTPRAQQLRRLGYLSFVKAHPDRAIVAPWVTHEHKDIAEQIIEERRARGIPPSLRYADVERVNE